MDGERLYQHHPNGKLIITSKQLNTKRTAAYVEHQCTCLAPAQKVAGYLMKRDKKNNKKISAIYTCLS
jgi:hypothetical protein